MATVMEEAAPAAMVGAGEKAEAAATPEKVDEVKEAGAGEEEMEVAAGETKTAAMVGAGEKAEAVATPEQVDEVKEAGEGEEEMEVAAGEVKKAEEGNEAKKAEGEQGKGKEKKPRSRKPRSAGPHHPPYFEMIKEVIMAAGDGKAGASAYAIAKRVGERHGEALPGNYRKVLAAQLRSFAAKGRLVRVKASFHLAPAEEKAALQAARPARPKRAKKAGPPAKPKAKQPKSIRARKANKASA